MALNHRLSDTLNPEVHHVNLKTEWDLDTLWNAYTCWSTSEADCALESGNATGAALIPCKHHPCNCLWYGRVVDAQSSAGRRGSRISR